MKTAKYRIVSIEIVCPFCDGEVHEPDSGSSFWAVTEIATGKQAQCENGHVFRLPRPHRQYRNRLPRVRGEA